MAIFNSYVKLPEGNTKQLGMGQHCQTWSNMKNALLLIWHAAIDMHWAPGTPCRVCQNSRWLHSHYVPVLLFSQVQYISISRLYSHCNPNRSNLHSPHIHPIPLILNTPQKPWWM